MTGVTFSAFPQELSLPSLGGAPGGAADSVDIDVEDDGSFALGRLPPGLRRRLALDRAAAARLDLRPARGARRRAAHRQPAARPQRARPGARRRSRAAAARSPRSTTTTSSSRRCGLNFTPTAGAAPVPAASEHREVVAAWRQSGEVKGRLKPLPTKPFDGEVTLSRPDLGPAAGPVAVGGDRSAASRWRWSRGRPPAGRSPSRCRTTCPAGRAPIARNAWQSGRRREAPLAPGPRPVGAAALPRHRRRQGGGRDDRLCRWCRRSRSAASGRSSTR